MISNLYESALLSAAAYARWDRDSAVIKSELIDNRGFTEEQYNWFVENYSVSHYEEDSVSGFSATLFKNEATQELTVAYRGTEPGALDFYQDIWLALGLGTIGGLQIKCKRYPTDKYCIVV